MVRKSTIYNYLVNDIVIRTGIKEFVFPVIANINSHWRLT